MEKDIVIAVIIAAITASILATIIIKLLDRLRKKDAESQAREIVDRAKQQMDQQIRESELKIKERELHQAAEAEKTLASGRQEIHERGRSLDKRQDTLDQQAEGLRKQEKMVENNQRKLAEKLEDLSKRNLELDKLLDVQRQTLHELSGLSKEEATSRLLKILDEDLKHETGALILKHEKNIEEICDVKAKETLITAMQRYAASHTSDNTTSTVDIPSDEMKGRIIGREGRNIRAFEKATGIDVIIDDTPGVVIVSGFDPVRREIARASLVKLIKDGRIHPTRIEEIVNETHDEVEVTIMKKGEEAAQEADVPGLHEKIIRLLGRLHFRTSYSQNVLRHSIEVSPVNRNAR